MAGRDSWTSPVNALLDGVDSTAGADTGAPDTDYGSPWARALRDIMERQTGVSADDLRYVDPYQPSEPMFGQPPITNAQWHRTHNAAPFLPSRMPDPDVTTTLLMPDGSGQFAPRPLSTAPAPMPVAYQDAERRWPSGGTLPTPWDPWYDQTIKGIQGLIKFFRSNRGANTPRGGGDDESCYDRWERELQNCRDFIGKLRNPRYLDACYKKANARHDLCVRNGGRPDPEEPDEYGLQDIPNDPAGRR